RKDGARDWLPYPTLSRSTRKDGARDWLPYPTLSRSTRKDGARDWLPYPTLSEYAKGWGTRLASIPHPFGVHERMGHAPRSHTPPFCGVHERMGHATGVHPPPFRSTRKDGARDWLPYPTLSEYTKGWGTRLASIPHPFEYAKDGHLTAEHCRALPRD